MSEATAFLSAIRARPDDDTARLVYADWLDEHGNTPRARFIRTQVWAAQGALEQEEVDGILLELLLNNSQLCAELYDEAKSTFRYINSVRLAWPSSPDSTQRSEFDIKNDCESLLKYFSRGFCNTGWFHEQGVPRFNPDSVPDMLSQMSIINNSDSPLDTLSVYQRFAQMNQHEPDHYLLSVLEAVDMERHPFTHLQYRSEMTAQISDMQVLLTNSNISQRLKKLTMYAPIVLDEEMIAAMNSLHAAEQLHCLRLQYPLRLNETSLRMLMDAENFKRTQLEIPNEHLQDISRECLIELDRHNMNAAVARDQEYCTPPSFRNYINARRGDWASRAGETEYKGIRTPNARVAEMDDGGMSP